MPSFRTTERTVRARVAPCGAAAALCCSGAGVVRLVLLLAIACSGAEERLEPPAPAATSSEATQPATPTQRGLWVLAEGHQRVLEHPDRIPTLIEDAGLLGATDLFVQVLRGGRAWFESSLADAGPYRALREASGMDTLSLLLRQAHAAGLRVHAWVNVLSLARNRKAPWLDTLGTDAVLVDKRGRSLLDYPNFELPQPDRRYYRMGTPALYLDPAAPGVAELVAATFAELLVRYPDLDGLHLDYIRYPDVLPFVPGTRFGVGLDFGYGAVTLARFRSETGLEAPLGDSTRNANRWDDWRRDKLTGLVSEIGARARAARPGVELSAAVWTYADRGYLVLGQDWRRWLEDDLIEFAVPMAYTLDDRLLRYQVERFANLPVGGRIWIGLGTWLFAGQPERALAQIRIARDGGAAAESLFSYDSIVATPALRDALVQDAAHGP